jgi:hypothetical protein
MVLDGCKTRSRAASFQAPQTAGCRGPGWRTEPRRSPLADCYCTKLVRQCLENWGPAVDHLGGVSLPAAIVVNQSARTITRWPKHD